MGGGQCVSARPTTGSGKTAPTRLLQHQQQLFAALQVKCALTWHSTTWTWPLVAASHPSSLKFEAVPKVAQPKKVRELPSPGSRPPGTGPWSACPSCQRSPPRPAAHIANKCTARERRMRQLGPKANAAEGTHLTM